MADNRQEGYITDTELCSDLKNKIDNSDTNSKNAKINIGIMSNLKTTDKSTIVSAVNEVKSASDTATAKANTASNDVATINSTIGTAALYTSNKTIKGAINELLTKLNSASPSVGNLTGLKTNSKDSVVNAINELVDSNNAQDIKIQNIEMIEEMLKLSIFTGLTSNLVIENFETSTNATITHGTYNSTKKRVELDDAAFVKCIGFSYE